MEKNKSAAECTREWVKKGTKYALFVGKKVYTLEGSLDGNQGRPCTVRSGCWLSPRCGMRGQFAECPANRTSAITANQKELIEAKLKS
jgi:hypothetical protein